jgi:hypothetical protein
MSRLFPHMKKYLFLSAVLLGTVATSHAGGIDFHFGIPLPPLPRIIIGHPAPRVIVQQPPVCLPAPPRVVYTPAPQCAPPPVVYVPPRVVYTRPYAYYSPRERAHDWNRRERGDHHRHDRH